MMRPSRSDFAADWFLALLGLSNRPREGERVELGGEVYEVQGGIARSVRLLSAAQQQTADAFGFKWHLRETFERPESLARMREWLLSRYGDVARAEWLFEHGPAPLLLDAGCGGAMSAIELLGAALPTLRYVGIDVSAAVEIAATRFREHGLDGGFLQTDLLAVPFAEASFDLVLAEGVLHHTDDTRAALLSLAHLLKPGGRFLFYVYRRKGPMREFTDDFIRGRLQSMSPREAWEALMPLTRLGVTLGRLGVELEIEGAVDLLQIPAGRIDLQRLFYWHVCKAFYRPELTLDEMNHINFDWYMPKNAHRQTVEEVRDWCGEAGLAIEREVTEEAGITIIARRHA